MGRFPRALRARPEGPSALLRRNRDSDRARARSRDAIDSLKVGPRHGAEDTRSASSRRLTCNAKDWAGGSGMRRARMSRTSARMCFSPTSSRSAISATETPRFKSSKIRLSRLAFAWRAARRASTDRSRGTGGGAVSTISDIPPSPSWRQENEDRIISEFQQEKCCIFVGGVRPARSGRGPGPSLRFKKETNSLDADSMDGGACPGHPRGSACKRLCSIRSNSAAGRRGWPGQALGQAWTSPTMTAKVADLHFTAGAELTNDRRIAPAIFVIDTGALGDAAFYVGLEGGVAPDGLRRRPRNIRTAVAALGPALRRAENDDARTTGDAKTPGASRT